MLNFLKDVIHETGVFEYGFLNPSEIEYHQSIRDLCVDNKCGQYGKTWACPPAVGTIDECKERCQQYDRMMVFTGLFLLRSSFDSRGMKQGMSDFKKIAQKLDDLLHPRLKKYLVLSNESCDMCSSCTYPDLPCRFPEKLHHSVEGYGMVVNDLAQKAGVKYNNGKNTLTFFGAILYNENYIGEH